MYNMPDVVQSVVKTEVPAPVGVVDPHQWCSSTTAQHYQLTSPTLFTASTVAQTSAFTTIQLNAVIEQTSENHLNSDSVDSEQHGVWQQL